MRKKGFSESFACMKNIIPELIASLKQTGLRAYAVLSIGAGAGLIIANNFASYSRFSGARNKIDKYFVVLIIAFTISYLLGKAKKPDSSDSLNSESRTFPGSWERQMSYSMIAFIF
jgi:hypothetical protein